MKVKKSTREKVSEVIK